MNAKTCKALRAAAKYKNATATPTERKFPGVGKVLQFPLVKRNENGHVWASNRFVFTGRWWQHDVSPVWNVGEDGKTTPAFELVPTTKPFRIETDQPRGQYRALKRLNKRVGLANIAAGLREAGEEQ